VWKRSAVQVPVDVVDEMKPPEPGDPVGQPEPVPERVVEQQDARRDGEPGWQLDEAQQADPMVLGPPEELRQDRRLKEPHDREPEGRQDQVPAEVA
jgi:hypothetical protein